MNIPREFGIFICIIIRSIMLIVVTVANNTVKSKMTEVAEIPIKNEVVETPANKPIIVYSKEQINLARAISRLYRHIHIDEAKFVVKEVYKYTSNLEEITPVFFLGLIAQESGFNRTAVSHAGATGYPQVIPK